MYEYMTHMCMYPQRPEVGTDPLELELQVFLTAGPLPSLRSFLFVTKLKGFEDFSFLQSNNLVVMGGTCLHSNLFYVLGKTINVFFSLPGK